jgi:hypothetical protein
MISATGYGGGAGEIRTREPGTPVTAFPVQTPETATFCGLCLAELQFDLNSISTPPQPFFNGTTFWKCRSLGPGNAATSMSSSRAFVLAFIWTGATKKSEIVGPAPIRRVRRAVGFTAMAGHAFVERLRKLVVAPGTGDDRPRRRWLARLPRTPEAKPARTTQDTRTLRDRPWKGNRRAASTAPGARPIRNFLATREEPEPNRP